MTSKQDFNLFGITNAIAAKLRETHLGCSFQFICDPPIHLTVTIMKTIVPIINPSFVIWAYSQQIHKDKPSFLTCEAQQMLDGVENVLQLFGGMTLSEIVRTGKPDFLYSGPIFDNDLLVGESLYVAVSTHTPRDVMGLIWNGDITILDDAAKRHISPYMFPYGYRGLGLG